MANPDLKIAEKTQEKQSKKYWQYNIRLIRNLLIIWAIVSLGLGILLVEPLNSLKFFELPLGFWIAQQGSILTFVVLTFIYAICMDRIDDKYKH